MRRITLLTNPDKCNLRCLLCFLNQRPRERRIFGMGEMPMETARAAIEKYVAQCDVNGRPLLQEVIPSTMGEPLLYSHFERLLDLCQSLGLPMNLTTNGTFPRMWGSDECMLRLLEACRDIKVSCMGFDETTVVEMMPGVGFAEWKRNVERLVELRNVKNSAAVEYGTAGNRVSTVSLQVTLHRKNIAQVVDILHWAASLKIDRIKWNPVVFLRDASVALKRKFALSGEMNDIRNLIVDSSAASHCSLKNEGSLFMKKLSVHFSKENGTCPFDDEVWILPDGTEEYCPSPERRYGDKCSKCCFI